ncbi:hypothetical protein OG885_00025 [Streptomyces sp. NBC_00028]|uniref:hypothetical protein n=1 Tax=Streptomyces sp. NBC_00028 TaxID=2975624 RepID=UPI0032437117
MVRPAWTAAASWIHAQRIGHLILLRAHTQTPARWMQLTRLQRCTGIHLTLVWHDTPERLNDRAQAWREASWALISEQEAAQQRLRRCGQRPALAQHGPNTADTEPAAHAVGWLQQVGHPLHAGLLAAQLACGQPTPQQLARVRLTDLAPDATALALPHPGRYRSPTGPGTPYPYGRAPHSSQPAPGNTTADTPTAVGACSSTPTSTTTTSSTTSQPPPASTPPSHG